MKNGIWVYEASTYLAVYVHINWNAIITLIPMVLIHPADIYDELDAQLEECGLVCECLGGGKIQLGASNTTLEVFGKSEVCILYAVCKPKPK